MSENALAAVALVELWGKVSGAAVAALALGTLLCLFVRVDEVARQRSAFPLVAAAACLLTYIVVSVVPTCLDLLRGTNLRLNATSRLVLSIGVRPALFVPVTVLALVGLRAALEQLPSRTAVYVLSAAMFFIGCALAVIWLYIFRPLSAIVASM